MMAYYKILPLNSAFLGLSLSETFILLFPISFALIASQFLGHAKKEKKKKRRRREKNIWKVLKKGLDIHLFFFSLAPLCKLFYRNLNVSFCTLLNHSFDTKSLIFFLSLSLLALTYSNAFRNFFVIVSIAFISFRVALIRLTKGHLESHARNLTSH